MGAPGLTSPIRPVGFEQLQLNAGVFLRNFQLGGNNPVTGVTDLKDRVQSIIGEGFGPHHGEDYKWAPQLLGMTRGGGTFTVKRDMRQPEVDGRRYNNKGASFVDALDAYFNGTLVEATYQNLEAILGTDMSDEDHMASKHVYHIHTAILADLTDDGVTDGEDYHENIVWVGDLADGRFVAIEILNALNTAEFTWTFQDKNEGSLPFEFHAHQATVLDYDVAPFKVYFFEGDALESKATANVSTRTAMPPQLFDGNYMSGSSLKKGQYMVSFSCQALKALLNNGFTLSVSLDETTVSVGTNHIVTGDIYHVPIVLTQIESAVWRASMTKPSGAIDKTIALTNFAIIDQTSL